MGRRTARVFHLLARDDWRGEKEAVEDQVPEGDQGDEVVELVGSVHAEAEHDGEEVHLEQHLDQPDDAGVAPRPEVSKVSVSGEEKIRGDKNPNVHVNRDRGRGSGHVVDQDDELHPTFPLVGLVSVHHCSVAGLLVEEDAEDGHVEDGQPKVDWCEVLVLLHEKVGPVADVEVGDNEGQLAQREEEGGRAVVRKVAEGQLTRPWYCLIVVPGRG